MYVIVVGGGKVGYYLTKTLVNEGYEVLLIEKMTKKVAVYAERFGAVVLEGDGAEFSTLEKAGMGRADVCIAVTGDDEDNLVICQTAKMQFDVPRTIARVNNPKNEELFKRLGIDVTVSATNIILSMIEQEIPERGLRHLLTLKHAQLTIVEGIVDPGSKVAGKSLSSLDFPPETVISVVLRDGSVTIPSGETVLQPRDEVIAIVNRDSESALRDMLNAS